MTNNQRKARLSTYTPSPGSYRVDVILKSILINYHLGAFKGRHSTLKKKFSPDRHPFTCTNKPKFYMCQIYINSNYYVLIITQVFYFHMSF